MTVQDAVPYSQQTLTGVVDALARAYPGCVSVAQAHRDAHAHGESWHDPAPPDAVFFAETTDQVSHVLTLCNRHGVPVIPFGAGSSAEAQVQAVQGGLALNTTRMNAILAIRPDDMDCTVQCGVTRQFLNEDLRATGLFFPVDLGAHATLGGMAATRASGTTTVRYGSMRDLVLSLTVVLPNGAVVRTGQRARKSAAGYDLTRLMVGSEGTLGVITELTLRLFGLPERAEAAMCSFTSIDAATQTVVDALQMGLSFNRIELADSLQMRAINAYSKTDWPEHPTLFVDLTGSPPAVAHDLALFEDLAKSGGAIRIDKAQDAAAYADIWRIRHSAYFAARALRPGTKGISTDVCVPISRLPECVRQIGKIIDENRITAPLIGHVGDGNFHLVLLFDPDDADEFDRARTVGRSLAQMAIAMEGTCTGEHGVGLGKKPYLAQEYGPALDLMRVIKRAIDPNTIMNPGKIFDL